MMMIDSLTGCDFAALVNQAACASKCYYVSTRLYLWSVLPLVLVTVRPMSYYVFEL